MTRSTNDCYKMFLRFGLLALCIFLLCTGRSFSQADTGSISGTVTDSSSAVVPGVKVTITAVATNREAVVSTDTSGRYASGPLRPGQYKIEAELSGFKRLTSQNIEIQVQQSAVMDLTMEAGAVEQSVTVTTSAPLVNTSDASQGSVIEEARVANLPLNGRNYLQLALLSEGALPPPGSHAADGANSNRAAGFTAGGMRTTDNNYLLDGFDNNVVDTSFDTNQAEVVKPSVDMIQEFKVQTNSYPAEFGRAAGGVVNLTTKSGTNKFHGTAYDFLRNEWFDARSYFNHGQKAPFKRNDYGLSVGGPIIRDKAFFFFAWEELKVRESNINNNTIPTAPMRQGDFSALSTPIYDPLTYDPTTGARQAFPNNIIKASRIDPVAQQLINFYPTPQNGNLSQNFIYIAPKDQDIGRINVRGDYQLTHKDQIAIIFNRQTNFVPTQPVLPAPAFGGDTRVLNVTGYGSGISWTHLFSPNFASTIKAGYFGDHFQIEYSKDALALGNVSAKVGLQVPSTNLPISYPNFVITGSSTLGPGNFLPVWSSGQTRQIQNDTNWVKGAHTIQFGGGAVWIQTNNFNSRNQDGTFNFSGRYTRNSSNAQGGSAIADFLLGQVDAVTFSTTTGVRARGTLLSAYVQDQWKVSPRLTLNYGLRYEYLVPFHDIYNRRANVDLDTNPQQPQLVFESQPNGKPYVGSSPLIFQPRLGLVYSLLKDKVVVRAGYGFYSPFQRLTPFGDSSSQLVNPPYDVAVTTSSGGITPYSLLKNGVPTDIVSLQNATNISLGSDQRSPPHAYNQQYNLNIQYQVVKDWLVQVGYIGSKGTHIANLYDANYVTSLGPGNVNSRRRFKSLYVPYSPTSPTGVTVTPLGAMQRTEYSGITNFNAMQTTITHKLSGGFTLLGTWIWSKALTDTVDGANAGITPGYAFQNPSNVRGEYGLSDTYLKHSVVVSGIWDIPFGKGRRYGTQLAPWADVVLGGWSFNGIMQKTSGSPFSVTVSGTPSNSGQTDRANVVGNPYSVPGGRSVAQFINRAAFAANTQYTYGNQQRNSIIGPQFTNIDFSLSKEQTAFKVKDQPINLQFRWDVFNIANHPNFSTPGNVLGTSTFGQITSSANPRQMQLALKLIY